MSVCPESHWDTFSYTSDSSMVYSTFHTDSNKIDPSLYQYCARVIIDINYSPDESAFSREESEALYIMEDELVDELNKAGVSCLMLGRLTHSGQRELIFQLSDWETFRPPVGRWMMSCDHHEIDVSEHDGWDFFYTYVWPNEKSWVQISDRQVIDNLIKSGSDPEKEHELEFAFTGPEEGLKKIQKVLTNHNFTDPVLSSDAQQLVMNKKFILDLNMIYEGSLDLMALSEEYGLEYDGWGALDNLGVSPSALFRNFI